MTQLDINTHTHSLRLNCSSFPSPLLGESEGARSDANWVKCSGKWIFPPGLLNSSSELALCVLACGCVSQFFFPLFFLLWVWECKFSQHVCIKKWAHGCLSSALFLSVCFEPQTGLWSFFFSFFLPPPCQEISWCILVYCQKRKTFILWVILSPIYNQTLKKF